MDQNIRFQIAVLIRQTASLKLRSDDRSGVSVCRRHIKRDFFQHGRPVR